MKKRINLEPHPEKSASRVSITSFMIGSLLLILTLIWTLKPENFSIILIYQLVLAIPLLFVSSLAYAKVGYWTHHENLDRFAWITNTTGNIFTINVIGLIALTFSKNLAWAYFILVIILIGIYYTLNVIAKPYTLKEKIIKFIIFILIIITGGIWPLFNIS